MSCDEFVIELPAYLRDELDANDRRPLEGHLHSCAHCRLELDRTRQVVEVLEAAGLAERPPGLKSHALARTQDDRIAEVIRTAALGPPPPADLKQRALERARGKAFRPVRSDGRRVPLVAAALAAAALAIALFAISSRVQIDRLQDELRDLRASVEERYGPAGHPLQTFALAGPGASAHGELVHFRHDNYRLRLEADDFPLTPTGHHYELWLTGDGGEVSLGSFRVLKPDEVTFNFAIGVDPADFPAVELTLERNDGDPSKSGEVLARARLDVDKLRHGSYEE